MNRRTSLYTLRVFDLPVAEDAHALLDKFDSRAQNRYFTWQADGKWTAHITFRVTDDAAAVERVEDIAGAETETYPALLLTGLGAHRRDVARWV